MKNQWSSFCLAIIASSFGCGSDPGDGNTAETTGPLLPWKEGNTWTYKVTASDGTVTNKITTVGPLEAVGGTGPNSTRMANKVTTEKANGADETQSWQSVDGNKVVRYRELGFDTAGGAVEIEEHWSPYKLRVDSSPELLVQGKEWLEIYMETKIQHGVESPAAERRDRWFIDQTSEKVTVPAGTFDAVLIRRVAGSSSVKRYWFAHGIGKIKETGDNQTEELADYEVAN